MSEHAHQGSPGESRKAVVGATLMLVALYGGTLAMGWPQAGTKQIVAQGHPPSAHGPDESLEAAGDHARKVIPPPFWTIVPFVLLLTAIAVLPLLPATQRWWESNVNRLKLAAALGALTLTYYAFLHHKPIEAHWPAHHLVQPENDLVEQEIALEIVGNAVMQEYIPFIVLLYGLYTISGGIRITGDLQADPLTNAAFLAVGGLLASFIGTTGAAMLLIRPLLETNKERKHVVHTIVFFIFVVCNCGGCLLPIGDPPLFLGYLQGVHFLWPFSLWKEWAFVNGLLVIVYVLLDRLIFYHRETLADVELDIRHIGQLKVSGWKLNLPLLAGVVLAVALLDPSKAFPGTSWHPWLYLREIVQLSLAAASLWWGSLEIREENHFSYHAIIEVAVLFIGIFITMQPALQILEFRGHELGINTPGKFFWITGILSSVLDNAPTYLVFFKTAQGMPAAPEAVLEAGVDESLLVAISLGAVFMGAMTYIGNGPNFMVKAIAERAGIKMPSFFGYLAYSCLFLLPLLILTWWMFLVE